MQLWNVEPVAGGWSRRGGGEKSGELSAVILQVSFMFFFKFVVMLEKFYNL